MEERNIEDYRKKNSSLSEFEQRQRDVYLKQFANGELQGPSLPYSEFSKPWLSLFPDDAIVGDIPKMNIYEYIKSSISKINYGDKVAIEYYGTKITYNEMFEKVEQTCRALKQMNIEKNDVVSMCLPLLPETIYLILALSNIGAVANIIDPRINEERIKMSIGTNSKAIFAIDTYGEKISNVNRELKVDNVVQIPASNSLNVALKLLYKLKTHNKKIDHSISWNEFINKYKLYNGDIKSVYEENQPVAIVYTSGTTGVPKGAMLSNDSIIGMCYQQKYVLPDMIPGDKFLDIMPPFIAYGLACGICATLSTGLEIQVIPKFDPNELDKLIMKKRPNHVLGVPSFFEHFQHSELLKNQDLSFIKYCIAGGDKLNIESEKKINDFFSRHSIKNDIIKGYGMTELSSGVFINASNESNKAGTVGTPLVRNNVKIVDPETQKLKEFDELGEVYVSGPSIMAGYLDNPEEENKVFSYDEAGVKWVKTGDLGSVDKDGNVTIHGRLKRMIVRPDGHNVFPAMIEDLIMTNPAVEACAVIGTKSDEYENGLIPTACIVLKDEYKGIENEITEQIVKLSSEKLPPRDVALRYEYIDNIPLTSVGKVDYEQIKKMIDSEEIKKR